MSTERHENALTTNSTRQLLEALFSHLPPGVIEVRVIEERRADKKPKMLDRRWFASVEEMLEYMPDAEQLCKEGCAGALFGVLPRRSEGVGKSEDTLPGRAAWADLDFRDFAGGEDECCRQLAEFAMQPSAIVRSGHGLHAYWLMREPQAPETLSGLSVRLAHALNGDHATDAARLLRLPGTINRKDPDAPVVVEVERLDAAIRYAPADLEEALGPEPQARPGHNGSTANRPGGALAIAEAISPRIQQLVQEGGALHDLFAGNGKPERGIDGENLDTSSSGYDYSLVSELARRGIVDPDELATALWNRPDGKARAKGGDYVERTVARALDSARPASTRATTGNLVQTYCERDGGIVWVRPTANGEVAVPLANFTARIVAEVLHDDGLERSLVFEIEAERSGQRGQFSIPADRFSGMGWVAEHLGAQAIVSAGVSAKDHCRAAIQTLSKDVSRRVVYCHTGWCKIAGSWCFLHAGGAIGTNGPVVGVEVTLPPQLERIQLPAPAAGVRLQVAIQSFLSLLDLAPKRITAPLLATVFRTPLGAADFSLHLSGPTGTGKTETAALPQQCFGADLDARNLPGSWSSTGNALEAVAFYAKDVLLVVDDFAPSGSSTDVARQHRQADRLLRAQGNRSGRARMASDASLRPVRHPRGITLSTGEDIPEGESLRARLLILEMAKKDLDWQALTRSQEQAREGLFAEAMAAYLQHLAPRMETLPAEFKERVHLRRNQIQARGHRRTSTIEAELACAVEVFLDFAVGAGAIAEPDRAALTEAFEQGIAEAAEVQAVHQQAAEPVARFLELIRSALTSGAGHLADIRGHAPRESGRWGWRSQDDVSEPQPQGRRMGWMADERIYLDLPAAYRVAQEAAGLGGQGLSVTRDTLARRMNEKALLAVEGDGKHLAVRRDVEGHRRRVYDIPASAIYPDDATEEALRAAY